MAIENNMIKLYDDIDFCSRYKDIATKYKVENRDNRLKKIDKKKVLEIFDSLGYEAIFNTKESFYKVRIIKFEYDFYFHVDIRSGLYELIFGVICKDSKKHIGGVIADVYDDILRVKQIEEESMSLPSFSNYEELESMLKESLSLFVDFKVGVLKLKP
ncbi:hypothetical protein [Confluentibacter sediminis]|uniref:hypothetical protein n=1 Tax=Confluentibacter sediminis TaxID=2219045 RepID=UPI000DAC699C|nr:hypothetical protein [Confluentibacter sediminis]